MALLHVGLDTDSDVYHNDPKFDYYYLKKR
jgi:hypothetical protein